MLNKVILMGRLTADPKSSQTPNGISVATFSLAVSRQHQKDIADFINIVAWRHIADFVSKYFIKGQQVIVEGSIQTRKYEDKQGNENKEVDIYTYVTKGTFDSYNYQTIENKQRYISQIMTSKNPVRVAEDCDELAINYAEIKAICADNPLIKERMELEVDLSRLKIVRQNFLNQKHRLVHLINESLPKEIEQKEKIIERVNKDIETFNKNKADDFSIVINGKTFDNREKAGKELSLFYAEVKDGNGTDIGTFAGFNLRLKFDFNSRYFYVNVVGENTYKIGLGESLSGNITRIENKLKSLGDNIENLNNELSKLKNDLTNAKSEYEKPFDKEDEWKEKNQRLREVDKLINEKENQKNDISKTDDMEL